MHEVLDRHGLDYELDWVVGGLPFLTTPGELVGAMQEAIRAETGIETELSTTGGTSDGRFISRICPQVIEFGPDQRHHPQDRRARARGGHRAAEEHLPAHAREPRSGARRQCT